MSRNPTKTDIENRGITAVSDIVRSESGHKWQEFDQRNDDGLDGLVMINRNGKTTGEVVFVQVKCGRKSGGYYREYVQNPDIIGINLGEKYINSHRPIWNKTNGPTILIFVDYDSKKSWWTDLRDEKSYSQTNKQIVVISKRQRFGIHSFGEFKKLKGYTFIDKTIDVLDHDWRLDSYIDFIKDLSVKKQAKAYYKKWGNQHVSMRNNPQIGEVIVSRVGWRHLTRRKRRKSRILQSLQLLAVAKRIILTSNKVYQVKKLTNTTLEDGTIVITDFLSLRRKVKFSHRGATVVQVLFKRKRFINKSGNSYDKVWLYSIYEPFVQRDI